MEPEKILEEAQKFFGSRLTLAFSGAEDVALINMASENGLPFSVFCLDTGRLHSQTYRYLDIVREHYGISLEVYTPSPDLLQPFLREKGLNSFYQDGHAECCRIRKVEPLGRALADRSAWVTGLRRDQSPASRGNLQHAEYDEAHPDEKGQPMVKINPLLDWDSQQVWDYIRKNDIPYNPLHDEGYRSIGCEPCTRPSRPGEHERAARWWWEDGTIRECGLHLK
jgi:phosphoadenosine phosphosulfate reductase